MLEVERLSNTRVHKSWTQVVLARQDVHTVSLWHFAFTEIYFLRPFYGSCKRERSGNNIGHVKNTKKKKYHKIFRNLDDSENLSTRRYRSFERVSHIFQIKSGKIETIYIYIFKYSSNICHTFHYHCVRNKEYNLI